MHPNMPARTRSRSSTKYVSEPFDLTDLLREVPEAVGRRLSAASTVSVPAPAIASHGRVGGRGPLLVGGVRSTNGVRAALDIGAAPCGDFGSYHAEPIDPRSGRPEPSVFIFPYGIVVNQEGVRFTDEAPGTVDAVYESITRKIFNQTNGIAYTILDDKINDVPNYKLGLRSDQPPITGATLAELAGKLKIPPAALEQTVRDYNAACAKDTKGTFKPLELDHLAAQGRWPQDGLSPRRFPPHSPSAAA